MTKSTIAGSQCGILRVLRFSLALALLSTATGISMSAAQAAIVTPHTALRHSSTLRVTNIVATAGDTTATVSWTAPANLGNKPVLKYTIQAYYKSPTTQQRTEQTKVTVDGNQTWALVTNLSNGMAYDFTITAENSQAWFAVNTSIMVRPSGLPCTPSGVQVFPANGKVTIKWLRPCTGGTPITFAVRAYVGDQLVATKSAIPDNHAFPATTISNLTNGVTYTVTVTSTNKNGSATSAPSAEFAPRKN